MKQSTVEMFLDRLDPEQRDEQLAFFRIMSTPGVAVVEELSGRIQRVSCPAGLKRLALEFAYYHPKADWIPVIERTLRHEKDLDLFETGARTLGRLRTPAALAALRGLSASRATPGFRELLDQVLQESDPEEAFKHHFARLLQGSAQPADANEGAHQLGDLLTAESLEPLAAAVGHPDPLVFRHALRLVGQIPTAAAVAFLLDYLRDTHQEALEDREVRVHLTSIRTLPRQEVLERCGQILGARRPEVAEDLTSGQADRVKGAVEALRAPGLGLLDTFLLDTLLAARDEKPTSLARHLSQAGEAAQQRARRIEFGMDSAAQGLAHLAAEGLLSPEQAIPPLAEALRHHTGRLGVASALARLVPPDEQGLIDLLLDEPDGAVRSAALEVLGERKDPALRPAFLKLRRDSIADIAQRSLWHLGRLPDPCGTARGFLAQAHPEEILVGLRFIALHRLEALLPDLLELAGAEGREDLQVAALETLASVGAAQAVEPVLALLHSGQSPRLQLVLAETLRDLGDAEGALALCGRARELNLQALHGVAVEALASAHGPDRAPLPRSASGILAATVRAAWEGRSPWPLRRRVAEALVTLHLEHPAPWADLAALLQDTLGEKRPPGEVAQEDLVRLQACTRTLAQRAQT